MLAGPMRERVEIQHKAPIRAAAGSIIENWTEFSTVFAAVEPISGREYTTLRAGQAEITTRFRIRYLAGVLPTMRVLWRGQVYRLSEVIDIGARRRELELYGSAEVV